MRSDKHVIARRERLCLGPQRPPSEMPASEKKDAVQDPVCAAVVPSLLFSFGLFEMKSLEVALVGTLFEATNCLAAASIEAPSRFFAFRKA
jgi:hypothetical protein